MPYVNIEYSVEKICPNSPILLMGKRVYFDIISLPPPPCDLKKGIIEGGDIFQLMKGRAIPFSHPIEIFLYNNMGGGGSKYERIPIYIYLFYNENKPCNYERLGELAVGVSMDNWGALVTDSPYENYREKYGEYLSVDDYIHFYEALPFFHGNDFSIILTYLLWVTSRCNGSFHSIKKKIYDIIFPEYDEEMYYISMVNHWDKDTFPSFTVRNMRNWTNNPDTFPITEFVLKSIYDLKKDFKKKICP